MVFLHWSRYTLTNLRSPSSQAAELTSAVAFLALEQLGEPLADQRDVYRRKARSLGI